MFFQCLFNVLQLGLKFFFRQQLRDFTYFLPFYVSVSFSPKLFKYRTAGVREYWIVNPLQRTVQVYSFEGTEDSTQYSFDDKITVTIYGDLKICVADLLK